MRATGRAWDALDLTPGRMARLRFNDGGDDDFDDPPPLMERRWPAPGGFGAFEHALVAPDQGPALAVAGQPRRTFFAAARTAGAFAMGNLRRAMDETGEQTNA